MQVHIWGLGGAGGAVSGHQPAKQCCQTPLHPLRHPAWRSQHPGDTQQCCRPHLHQSEYPQAAVAPSNTHVPQCEYLTAARGVPQQVENRDYQLQRTEWEDIELLSI